MLRSKLELGHKTYGIQVDASENLECPDRDSTWQAFRSGPSPQRDSIFPLLEERTYVTSFLPPDSTHISLPGQWINNQD